VRTHVDVRFDGLTPALTSCQRRRSRKPSAPRAEHGRSVRGRRASTEIEIHEVSTKTEMTLYFGTLMEPSVYLATHFTMNFQLTEVRRAGPSITIGTPPSIGMGGRRSGYRRRSPPPEMRALRPTSRLPVPPAMASIASGRTYSPAVFPVIRDDTDYTVDPAVWRLPTFPENLAAARRAQTPGRR
jgi:hypothetical protein